METEVGGRALEIALFGIIWGRARALFPSDIGPVTLLRYLTLRC